jgi:hypothetical protein
MLRFEADPVACIDCKLARLWNTSTTPAAIGAVYSLSSSTNLVLELTEYTKAMAARVVDVFQCFVLKRIQWHVLTVSLPVAWFTQAVGSREPLKHMLVVRTSVMERRERTKPNTSLYVRFHFAISSSSI